MPKANTIQEYINLYISGVDVKKIESNEALDKELIQYLEIHKEESNDLLCLYGRCLEEGIGTEKHIEAAVDIYKSLANQNYAKAQNNLGYCYEKGQGVEQSYEEAAKWFRKSAEQGYAEAQYNVGILYANGQGVEQSYEEAAKWYRQAAEQGHAKAKNNLGALYANGQGVEQSYEEAAKWYRQAAEQGHAKTKNNLGALYANGQGVEQSYEEAAKWYRQAAEQGYAEAQYNVGILYANGRGVEQSYEEAVKWYRQAAEQGYAEAQYNLGVYYANGRGVEQSYEEAAKWFRKSAEQGDAEAQYNVGILYANGRGVEQSYEEAAKWFRKSAEQGDAKAQNNLGVLYANGQGVEQSYEEAAKWFRKSAEQGCANAQYNLGRHYRYGKGVAKDYVKAKHYFEESAKQYYKDAYKELSELYLITTTSFFDKEKALFYEQVYIGKTIGQAYKTIGYYLMGVHTLYEYTTTLSDIQRYKKAQEYFAEAIKNGEVSAEADLEQARQKYEDAIMGRNHLHVGKRKDIFISWNHLHKEIKDKLYQNIEENEYYTCWQSDRDCNGIINDVCRKAVSDSDLLIVILTGNSLESKYVQEEVETFLNKIGNNELLQTCVKPIILNVKKDKKGKNKFFDVYKEIDRLEAKAHKMQKLPNGNNKEIITPFAKIKEYGSSYLSITKKDKLNNDLSDLLDDNLLSDIIEFIKQGLQMPKIQKYQKLLIHSSNTFYGALQSTLVGKQISYSTRLDINVGYIDHTLISDKQNTCLNSDDLLTIPSPILIYGEGGLGKSLLIKKIIYHNFTEANFFFYLPCKSIMKYNANTFSEILSMHFEAQLGNTAKSLDCISTILNNEENKDIFIVVDALDEISIEDKTTLFQMIQIFNRQYKEKLHFIFTSRNVSDEALISNALETDISTFTLKGITTEDIGKMFDNLLGKTDYSVNKELFLNSLATINDDIKRNPMLISNLIIIYFLTGGIPNRQYDILLKMVDIVFKNLEKDRDVRFDYHNFFNEEELSRILEFIGYHRSLNNKISSKDLLQRFYENNSMFKEEVKHKTWLIAESVDKYLSDRAILVQGNINHQLYSDFFASSYCYHKAYLQAEDAQGFYLTYVKEDPIKLSQLIQNIVKYGDQWNSIVLYFILHLDYMCNEMGITHKITLKLLKESFKACLEITQVREQLVKLLQSGQLYHIELFSQELKN